MRVIHPLYISSVVAKGNVCSYFRARRGATLIDAKTQKRIAALFRKEGITTVPEYDEVVESYKWF